MLTLVVNKRSKELWRGYFALEPYPGQILTLEGYQQKLKVASTKTMLGKDEAYFRVVVEPG